MKQFRTSVAELSQKNNQIKTLYSNSETIICFFKCFSGQKRGQGMASPFRAEKSAQIDLRYVHDFFCTRWATIQIQSFHKNVLYHIIAGHATAKNPKLEA